MLEGYFLFAVLFRVSHMGVLDSGTHCGCPNWTAARKQDIFIIGLFDHTGLKVRAAQNNNTPYWQDSTTFEVFKHIACCFGGDVNTEQLFDVISPARAWVDISSRSSFHTTHGVEAAEHSSGVPTIGPNLFTIHATQSWWLGSPGCSQCCCLMSCYLGCFVVRREACRRCGGGSPKVPGCRLEKESPLRIFRTNRWDVEGSLGKILGPRIFLRNPWSELNQAAACPAILSDFGEGRMPKQSKVRTWMWCDHWQLM